MFFGFSTGLPKADIVHQIIYIRIESLLPLLRAPDFDPHFNEPFKNKRRLVRDTPKSIKHEHEQNIKFSFFCGDLQILDRITFLGRNFISGDTFLIKLLTYRPPHFLGKSATCRPLHRDIIMIDLSLRRHAI